MTLSISGPEINNATTAVESAANNVSRAASELESHVNAWSEAGASIYEPKLITILKWTKAALIAIFFAALCVVGAALKVAFG